MTFPDGDARILHAPGECDYCDKCPVDQWKRLTDRVNFTGHHDPKFAPCPADVARGPESYNRWGGNVPSQGEVLGHDWAGYPVTPAAPRLKGADGLTGEERMAVIADPERGKQYGYSYPEPGIPFIISPRVSVLLARIRVVYRKVAGKS